MEECFFARKQFFVQNPFSVFTNDAEFAFLCRFVQLFSVVADNFFGHIFQNPLGVGGKTGSRDKNSATVLFALSRLPASASADKLLHQGFPYRPKLFVPFFGIPILRLYVDGFLEPEFVRQLDLAVDSAIVIPSTNPHSF